MLSPSCFSCKTMLMGTDGVHCLCGISIHYKCLKSAGDISQSWGNNNSPSSLMKTILNSSAFRYKCSECRTHVPSVSNPPSLPSSSFTTSTQTTSFSVSNDNVFIPNLPNSIVSDISSISSKIDISLSQFLLYLNQ